MSLFTENCEEEITTHISKVARIRATPQKLDCSLANMYSVRCNKHKCNFQKFLDDLK